jgi:hypothetical protein
MSVQGPTFAPNAFCSGAMYANVPASLVTRAVPLAATSHASNTEIRQLCSVAAGIDKDVARLDISVQNTRRMSTRQRIANADADLQYRVNGQSTYSGFGHPSISGDPGQIFHDDVRSDFLVPRLKMQQPHDTVVDRPICSAASLRSASTCSGEICSPGRSVLMATTCRSTTSHERYTMPIPPRPISSNSTYLLLTTGRSGPVSARLSEALIRTGSVVLVTASVLRFAEEAIAAIGTSGAGWAGTCGFDPAASGKTSKS